MHKLISNPSFANSQLSKFFIIPIAEFGLLLIKELKKANYGLQEIQVIDVIERHNSIAVTSIAAALQELIEAAIFKKIIHLDRLLQDRIHRISNKQLTDTAAEISATAEILRKKGLESKEDMESLV